MATLTTTRKGERTTTKELATGTSLRIESFQAGYPSTIKVWIASDQEGRDYFLDIRLDECAHLTSMLSRAGQDMQRIQNEARRTED